MKVKMVTRAAGPGGVWEPGSVVEVDSDVAKELVQRGFAVVVRGERETATVAPSETSNVKRKASGGKRQTSKEG